MPKRKTILKLIFIVVFSMLLVIIKNNNTYGVNDFTYKIGDGAVSYKRTKDMNGQTQIEYGATNVIHKITREENIGKAGNENLSFYCAAKKQKWGEGSNTFMVSGFIEIGNEGYTVTQYRGGSSAATLTKWEDATDEFKQILLGLYYILVEPGYEYGFHDFDGTAISMRQFSLWQELGYLDRTFNFKIIDSDENSSKPYELDRTFFNDAQVYYENKNLEELKTVRIWYFSTCSETNPEEGFMQSSMMVVVGDLKTNTTTGGRWRKYCNSRYSRNSDKGRTCN